MNCKSLGREERRTTTAMRAANKKRNENSHQTEGTMRNKLSSFLPSLTILLTCLAVSPAQPTESAPPALPFSIKVDEESFPDQDRPDYMSSRNPSEGMDFPYS